MSNRKGKVWKFCENRDVRARHNFDPKKFSTPFENDWLYIDQTHITVKGSNGKGYAWDGCSPKVIIADMYFGTPDGRTVKQAFEVKINGKWVLVEEYRAITYLCSIFHDPLYQFHRELPLSRKEIDDLFLWHLEQKDFASSKLYYNVVRVGGGIYGKWKTK